MIAKIFTNNILHLFITLYKSSIPGRLKYATIVILILCFSLQGFSQQIKLIYKVKHGSKVIGSMSIYQNLSANNTVTFQLESHIKTSFIISVAVDAKEESVFQNGVLTYSSVYRKVNGSEKINKKHRGYGKGYLIEYNGKTDTVCCKPIRNNLMTMYASEPLNITQVYSDNYQKFLLIKKLSMHLYKISMPDGSYNIYQYQNGRCIKVEVHQSLYTATMELT